MGSGLRDRVRAGLELVSQVSLLSVPSRLRSASRKTARFSAVVLAIPASLLRGEGPGEGMGGGGGGG